MEALWLDLKRVICTLRLGWSSPQAGTNREPPNRERRKDRHRAQSPERAKPRSRRRPRSRTPPGIRETVGPRAAPAVPGTFPERPRQRAGRKESPPSRPRSSPRKGDAASVMRQSLKRLPSGRRMQPAAVKMAVEDERARTKGQMEAFFAKAGMKNTVTGKPITTLEEFDAWQADYEAARLQKDLKAGKLTPEALRSAVEQTPAIQALKKQQEQRAAEDEQRRQAEAKARVDAELAEIHKLDPAINTVEDLLSMPDAKAFYDLVRKGNSFLDAYRLANFDRLQAARAEAARQQAMNNARGKDHLTGTGTPQGTGAATVPPDEMQAFKLFNPTATEAEITAWYNKHKK